MPPDAISGSVAHEEQPRVSHMSAEQFRAARDKLGALWGLERPLTQMEMARVLRLGGERPDQSIRAYERNKTPISGPISLALELLLAGAQPAGLEEWLRS